MSAHSFPTPPPSRPGGGAPGSLHAGAPPLEPDAGRYEYRQVTLPRGTSRSDARALLTEQAEYGRWELSRVTLFLGGARQVRLRRRVIRVQRTS